MYEWPSFSWYMLKHFLTYWLHEGCKLTCTFRVSILESISPTSSSSFCCKMVFLNTWALDILIAPKLLQQRAMEYTEVFKHVCIRTVWHTFICIYILKNRKHYILMSLTAIQYYKFYFTISWFLICIFYEKLHSPYLSYIYLFVYSHYTHKVIRELVAHTPVCNRITN